jgi:hypothetical protein
VHHEVEREAPPRRDAPTTLAQALDIQAERQVRRENDARSGCGDPNAVERLGISADEGKALVEGGEELLVTPDGVWKNQCTIDADFETPLEKLFTGRILGNQVSAAAINGDIAAANLLYLRDDWVEPHLIEELPGPGCDQAVTRVARVRDESYRASSHLQLSQLCLEHLPTVVREHDQRVSLRRDAAQLGHGSVLWFLREHRSFSQRVASPIASRAAPNFAAAEARNHLVERGDRVNTV